MTCRFVLATLLSTLCALPQGVSAQDSESGPDAPVAVESKEASAKSEDGDVLNKANDPLADMISVQLRNYYSPKLYGVPDEAANTFWLRIVAPFGRVIPRVSLPVQTSPAVGADSKTGLGDLDVLAWILVTKPKKPTQFGIGPLYVAPTATNDALGSGKHQIGVASVVVYPTGPLLIAGIATWQISVAGDDSRPRAQSVVVQPLITFQLGSGYYLRSSPNWLFDIETGDYNIPFGLGVGKVLPYKRTVFNLFIEPQFTLAHKGVGQPAIQVYAGIQIQFLTGKR